MDKLITTPKRIKLWIFSLVTLILTIALVTAIVLGVNAEKMRMDYASKLSAVYQRSYYDLVADLNDLEVKLSKVQVGGNGSYQEELLSDIWKQTDFAESNLSQLSSKNSVVVETSRFINQLGDYSYHLLAKLRRGESLSLDDYESIRSLHSVCMSVSTRLNSILNGITQEDFFGDDGGLSGAMDEIENTSIDYPELIYDGPFSDSVTNRMPKGLKGDEISVADGESIANNLLKPLGHSVTYRYTSENKFKTYHYESDSGASVTLAYTGELLNMNIVTQREEAEYTQEQCIEIAKGFLVNTGFINMTEVWASNYYNTYYINFVTETDGVICYNDMVKVKVSAATGKVVGFDGLAYAYNHEIKSISLPTVTEEEALSKADGLTNTHVRLALVPKNSQELLTYEIYGELDAYKYFIYVDATTGETVNVLRVVDSEQGALLM